MTTRLSRCARLLIATLVLAVTVVPAQMPNTQTPKMQTTANTDRAGKSEFHLTPLQALLNKPAGFSLMPEVRIANVSGSAFSITPLQLNLPVLGGGTPGRITKWVGSGNNSVVVGNSVITEDSQGKIGIGTTSPTSPLTVQGMIETKLGGIKFPDGTVQATATVGGLQSVIHDATLTGNGTAASPLSVVQSGGVGETTTPVQFVLNSSSNTFIVPAGKRLVIEFVSGAFGIQTASGDRFGWSLFTTVGSTKFKHHAFAYNGQITLVYYISQPVRLYADPGTTVESDLNTFTVQFEIVVTGYYVNVP
jgi:hypothetical protein